MSKFYCRFCKIYIDDNRAQRTQHELGSRHKEAVERSLASQRAKKQKEQQTERDIEAQLEAIDSAARRSINETFGESTKSLSGNDTLSRKRKAEGTAWNDECEGGNGDNGGIYTIDGRSYMTGDEHKDKLIPGTLCEVFIEEDEKGWLPASISLRHDQDIPHSDAKITTFDVTYFEIDNAGSSVPVFATSIKPDCLRIEYHGTIPEASGVVEEAREVVESTGLGKWQTIDADEEKQYETEEPRPPRARARGTHEGVVEDDNYRI